MKKILFSLLAILLFSPDVVIAANNFFTVTPAIIDEKAFARDILKDEITITNNSGARVDVYAWVQNIDVEAGEQEFLSRADVVLGDSLANWIQVSRGVIELSPGESAVIPVTIHVNLNAKPGKYHAVINLSRGSTRAEAESRPDLGSSIAVNVEVTEDVKERLQLGSFVSNKIFFGGPDVSFAYDLENIGNKDLTPTGEVRIFDRKGREIGAVPANIEGTTIEPNNIGQIASVWSAGKSFGKYKALLDIEYGNSQLGTVNDTIYFWIVPWKQLLAIFLMLAIVVGGGTYVMYKRYERRRQPAYVRAQAQKYRKFDEDSLLVPQHAYDDGSPKPLSNDHLLNLRS